MAQSSTQRTVSDLPALLSSARWAMRLAWSTNRRLLAGMTVVVLSRGLVPAALAITARGLVNAALVAIRSDLPSLGPLVPWLLLGFLLTAIEGITSLMQKLFMQRLRDDLNYRVTLDILNHAATLGVAPYEDPRVQDILERAQQTPGERLARFVSDALACGSGGIQIVSLLAVLIFIEPLILLVAILFALPYLRFHWRLALQQYALERGRTTKRRWGHYFVSTLTGRSTVGEVTILRLAPLLIERFRSLMVEFQQQDRKLYRRSFRGGAVFVVATTAAMYTVFLRVVLRAVGGHLTLGDVAVFGGATTRLRNTLEGFVLSVSSVLEQTLHVSHVIEFLNLEPSRAAGAGIRPATALAELIFENVSFTYPGSKDAALQGVSLHIRAGETVALVGENGAGKTTLVKLIAGLYDPNDGRILFDGIDLRDLSREHLHEQIAFVFQDFGRYETSAGDNVAYGDWGRLLGNAERIKEVATLAGVHDLIGALPRGYETLVGRLFGETDLSGGEWQKLAVARAFARSASLLILDEPTSNLDARAEYNLFCRFQQLAKGRTTVIVSHRFSTVSMAHRILVLDRGRIVESGSHDELLAREGNYAQLYALHQHRMGYAP
jgi:ATP-binding cassette subfamily B protein